MVFKSCSFSYEDQGLVPVGFDYILTMVIKKTLLVCHDLESLWGAPYGMCGVIIQRHLTPSMTPAILHFDTLVHL